MKQGLILRYLVGGVLICGGIWRLATLPDTANYMKPGFVGPFAIGVGCIGTALLIAALRPSRAAMPVVAIALLWSLLLNAYFYAQIKDLNILDLVR
jgi:hypothetical protein